MDSTQLRLWIFALGILLILGIYLWDKLKQPRYKKQHDDAVLPLPNTERNEPFIDQAVADENYNIESMSFKANEVSETALSNFIADLSFNAQGVDEFTLDPALREVAPRKIIQLTIAAPEHQAYTAHAVAEAANAVELRYQEGIYQRLNNDNAVMFSLASMLEPGMLPRDDDDFTTSGLILFSELPGVCDGLAIYSDMLFTAERLVALLDGTLLDENRSVLSKQTVEHTREAILEHRRQIQLLKKHDKR